MKQLIDMLDQHISKHKDYANRFDTGAMVARNFAIALLDKEKEQICEAWELNPIEHMCWGIHTGEQYYREKFKSE
jgi:hypothetical protein